MKLLDARGLPNLNWRIECGEETKFVFTFNNLQCVRLRRVGIGREWTGHTRAGKMGKLFPT